MMRDIRKPDFKKTNKPPALPELAGRDVPVSKIHLSGPQPPPVPGEAPMKKRPLFFKREINQPKRRQERVGGNERTVLLAVFGMVIIAAILAAVIFLPAAHIKLVLRTAPLLVDQKLTIKAEAADANTIPGTTFFRESQFEGTSAVTSTETIGTKAHGSVQIVNKTSDEQKIKERSRLVTKEGTLFYMQTHVIVPPNSQASVVVEAAEAGEAGNVGAQRLTFAALDSAAQNVVYGEVTTPLTGGSGNVVAVAKDSDMDEAKAAAAKTARERAEGEIRKELPQGWVILEESWNVEAKTFETNVKVDDQIAAIPYTGRFVVRVLGYEEAKLTQRLETALNEKLSRDYMLFPGPISHTATVESIDWEKAEGVVNVRVTHTTIPRLSVDALRDKLAGRTKEEAQSYLQGLPAVQSATTELGPFWVQSIPRIERRVYIDLESERQP